MSMNFFGRLGLYIFIFIVLMLMISCDPVTRHKVLTTLFDGVPSLPPHMMYCPEPEVHKKKLTEGANATAEKEKILKMASIHKPFDEKRCKDCHDFSGKVGFVVPLQDLCLHCHKGFIKGQYVHGPVAVGSCLACHLPHDSKYNALLQEERSKICEKCHWENRVAASMHKKVIEHDMACVDCHDPHFGDVEYFLK